MSSYLRHTLLSTTGESVDFTVSIGPDHTTLTVIADSDSPVQINLAAPANTDAARRLSSAISEGHWTAR